MTDKKYTTSDVYNYLFEKTCGQAKEINKEKYVNNLQKRIDELTVLKVKISEANGMDTLIAAVNSAQKKARSWFMTLFIFYIIVTFGYIFWTMVITGRIISGNRSYGISEANYYIIYTYSIFWYSLVYLIMSLWLVRKRTCSTGSLWTTIIIVLIIAFFFLWFSFSLVGIMQKHGKDCVLCTSDPSDKCDITQSEKDNARVIFIISICIIFFIILAIIVFSYGVRKSLTKK